MKSDQVGVGSNIAQNHSFSLWEVIFAPIHMKSLPEVKLSKGIICPYLGLSTLILPQYTIFGPYLPIDKTDKTFISQIHKYKTFIYRSLCTIVIGVEMRGVA